MTPEPVPPERAGRVPPERAGRPSAVAVVGAGVMGAGIAQVAAAAGYDVTLVDLSRSALDAARAAIAASLARLVRAGATIGTGPAAATLTSARAGALLEGIATTTDLDAAVGRAGLVVEAIVEDLSAKRDLLRRIDRRCPVEAVLASNTSQFPITELAAATAIPGRVIGMHWSNPPPVMRLVELVPGTMTSAGTVDFARRFVERCGHEYVVCRKDSAGFISNRLGLALFAEAGRLVDDGLATPAEIDLVARMMFGHRMGPLETQDMAGLDTVLRGAESMAAYHGPRFAPARSLRDLVRAGRLGRKTGAGFHDYAAPADPAPDDRPTDDRPTSDPPTSDPPTSDRPTDDPPTDDRATDE